jgi:hypothetical protein
LAVVVKTVNAMQAKRSMGALLLTMAALCGTSARLTTAARAAETFGAEANPTGSPIGGGKGYRRLVARGDFHVRTADELIAALKKAASGQVVYVDDAAKIDLTAAVRAKKTPLLLPGGVTLASGRGRKGAAGGLIFSDEYKTYPLFRTAGASLRVTGLRVRGPDPETRAKELARRLKEGGHKLYYAFPTSDGIQCDHPKLEVDNCELSGWSHAAVYLRKGATAAHVHHNHIHHCQRYGLGYGVCLNQADALIEANDFDYCRHHIAGTGRPGTSYEARYNLVGPHANGHSFDMHGGADRKDGTHVAGTWMRIHHNTFRATRVPAVVIRGRPEQLADIHHNWFLHANAARAVRQTNAKGNVKTRDNRYGPKGGAGAATRRKP